MQTKPMGHYDIEDFASKNLENPQLNHLDQAMQAIIELDDVRSNQDAHKRAETEAYLAIHNYCDNAGVGVDEDGQKVRLDFARAIDSLILSKSTLGMVSQGEFLSPSVITEIVKSSNGLGQELSPEEEVSILGHLPAAPEEPKPAASRWSKILNLRRASKKLPAKELLDDREQVKSSRKRSKFIGAVAVAALSVGLVLGAFSLKGNDGDESELSVPSTKLASQPVVQSSTTSSITTIDTQSSSTVSTMGEPSPEASSTAKQNNTEDTGASNPPVSPPVAVSSSELSKATITIPASGKVWNELEVLAVGAHGPEADANQDLQNAIANALSPIALYNNVTVDSLSHVSIGDQIEIPEATLKKLNRFRS